MDWVAAAPLASGFASHPCEAVRIVPSERGPAFTANLEAAVETLGKV